MAYGKFDHQDWCSHKVHISAIAIFHSPDNTLCVSLQSYLCTWNLDSRSLDASKADITIDVPVSFAHTINAIHSLSLDIELSDVCELSPRASCSHSRRDFQRGGEGVEHWSDRRPPTGIFRIL